MRSYLASVVVSILGAILILACTFSATQSQGKTSKTAAAPAASDASTKPQPKEKATYVGADTCLTCHSAGQAKGWMQEPHGRFLMDPRRKGDGKGCEECHGPGSLHVDDPPHNIIAIGKLSPRAASEICIKCHSAQVSRHDWLTGPHAMAGLRCGDCHKVHEPLNNSLMLPKPKSEFCLDCHKDVKNQLHQLSHHPILEGKMDCTDCHNVHSGQHEHMLISDEKTTCTRCHADNRGPFVYEHDVTVDGYAQPCTSCHTPHGSPNQRLFKIGGNGLCLQCHTTQAVNHFPGSCTLCHTRPHGSNVDPKLLQ